MKPLLLGHLGSIGRRYAAILNHFGIDWVGHDTRMNEGDIPWGKVDSTIIATPTATHGDLAWTSIEKGLPTLCEKPLSKSLDECMGLDQLEDTKKVPGFVVCNYKYVVRSHAQRPNIVYDYYNTGKDLVWWDVCQLVYLDPHCTIRTRSPIWTMTVNDKTVVHEDVERSYATMVLDFLEGRWGNLWSFEDGANMTKAVLERMEREGIDWCAGTDGLDEAS